MVNKNRTLPEFGSPPVVEVALAIQFEPIEDLTPVRLGLLAIKLRDVGFTSIETYPPLQPVVEHMDTSPSRARVTVEFGLPNLRHWFITEDRNRIIQIQPDRFIHNWRKVGQAEEYPRYEGIRQVFIERLKDFLQFVSDEGLGSVRPNQVEVTYVNHIRIEPEGTGHELSEVVGIAGASYCDGFLPKPEDAMTSARYLIEQNGSAIGRLHVNAHSAIDQSQDERIVVLKLTARGAPSSPDIDGVLEFLNLGREWVVRGFADVTTPAMHKAWRRKQ